MFCLQQQTNHKNKVGQASGQKETNKYIQLKLSPQENDSNPYITLITEAHIFSTIPTLPMNLVFNSDLLVHHLSHERPDRLSVHRMFFLLTANIWVILSLIPNAFADLLNSLQGLGGVHPEAN